MMAREHGRCGHDDVDSLENRPPLGGAVSPEAHRAAIRKGTEELISRKIKGDIEQLGCPHAWSQAVVPW